MRFSLLTFFFFGLLLAQDSTQYDESFDPLQLNEPPLEFPLMIRPGTPEKRAPEGEVRDTTVMGYRIQVLATQDYQAANALRDGLQDEFVNEVYITFDSPNYKVRIGNFLNRSEAEKIQKKLVQMGYRTAWIIHTQIIRNPRPW